MRYHVTAWGSEEHPDLDCEMDGYPSNLAFKYPYVSIAMLNVIRIEDIESLFDKAKD